MQIPRSSLNSVFHAGINPIPGGEGYCHITVPEKTCDQLSFSYEDEGVYQLANSSGTPITSSTATTTISDIQVSCNNGSPISYPFTNSTVSLNLSDPANPRLEFTPKSNADLGCQYNNGDNYLAFACNDTNDGVDAVQYKCGL